MAYQALIQVSLLSDLRIQPITPELAVLVIGKNIIDDGQGGFYRWDAASTVPEDSFMNVVASTLQSTGRWVRIFQRVKQVPQGVLVANGNVKTLFVNSVTDANGECKIYLTSDNTPNGPAIFTEIWKNISTFRGDAPSITEAVQSYVKVNAETGLLKTTTHGYYKVKAINILLGGVIAPIASVGIGVPVVFEIVGV